MRDCPACGEPFEDDGDRVINDECFFCGWATPYRRQRNLKNSETLAAIRRREDENLLRD